MDMLEKEEGSNLLETFARNAQEYPDQKRKLWMPRFDDEAIRNREMFKTKLDYIHNNPVQAGIVDVPEDYKYSSARSYLSDDETVLAVDTEWYT